MPSQSNLPAGKPRRGFPASPTSESIPVFPLRSCVHNRGMLDGGGFFSSDKELFRSDPDGSQGKSTRYDGKKTGQTVFNGYECSF